jgi:glycosyltransferase involved in cell wall biosynthesis
MLAAEGVATTELSPGTSAEWFGSFRPDVVSSHYAPNWMLEAATDQGIPWVETLHGMHSFFHPDSWAPERVRAERIAAQIAVSELVRRQYLVRNPAYPAQRLVTVPNGVDRDRLADVDRAAARRALGLADEFLFVSLARYCLQKNTFGLVSAFADVARRHPEAHLLVAGKADDLTYFEQTSQHARSLPAGNRIHLRGHCSNPSALLAAADAFVLDSFFEGWSLASMQALTAGLPVVVSDVGGAREQVGENGDCGYLIPNPGGDPALVDWRVISAQRFRAQANRAQAVAAMSALVRDRDVWASRREQLREAATGRFSADECLGGHEAVLRRVALGRSLADLSPPPADLPTGVVR